MLITGVYFVGGCAKKWFAAEKAVSVVPQISSFDDDVVFGCRQVVSCGIFGRVLEI
ncbi:MAG: hypothetical protein V3T49_09630 [Dehalococcoidia bacterium]